MSQKFYECFFCKKQVLKFKNNAKKEFKKNLFYSCISCRGIYSKNKTFPLEVIVKLCNQIPLTWQEYKTYMPKSHNTYVKIYCIKCSRSSIESSKKISNRKHEKEEICKKCILKATTNNYNWKLSNSKAQKIAQNKHSQKIKNALGVSKSWNRERREKASLQAKNNWQNETYIKKQSLHIASFNGLKGYYKYQIKENSYQWILFDSSYELCFLNWLNSDQKFFSQPDTIRRCLFYITYEYEKKTKRYFPDFLFLYENYKKLIEIKSNKMPFYSEEKEAAKKEATNKWILKNDIDEYLYIDESHFLSEKICFKKSSSVYPLCKKLYQKNKLFLISKKNTERYIGHNALIWQDFQKA